VSDSGRVKQLATASVVRDSGAYGRHVWRRPVTEIGAYRVAARELVDALGARRHRSRRHVAALLLTYGWGAAVVPMLFTLSIYALGRRRPRRAPCHLA